MLRVDELWTLEKITSGACSQRMDISGLLHTQEVTGSSPVSPTIEPRAIAQTSWLLWKTWVVEYDTDHLIVQKAGLRTPYSWTLSYAQKNTWDQVRLLTDQ